VSWRWLGAAVASFAVSGCESTPCPETWEDTVEHYDYCEPPAAVRARAEAHVKTGVFGYAMWLEQIEGDSLDVGPDEMMASRDGPIRLLLPESGGYVDVPLDTDGTFAVTTPAGDLVQPGAGTWILGDDDVDFDTPIQEGEVRFLVVGVER